MDTPLLLTAANRRNFIAFEAYDTPQWFAAVEWLTRSEFHREQPLTDGSPVIELDEGVMPSFVKGGIRLLAGWDNWSGNYLLAECEHGDSVLAELAKHVAAEDRRSLA